MPEGATTAKYADDVGVVVLRKHLNEVRCTANKAIENIRQRILSVGLQLAAQKPAAVLVTGRKVRETITLTVGGCKIQSQCSLRYISTSMMLD